ncbi:hypothetical protein [Desertibacillus haloalkaliphilus]|uniref:hypothetical protein n=1 Tax=Desertibacillus haloalkaliphilus TaxID=1328930 RepID=UPI001C251775|nr:hypothetical protein [Desertibacillus haloalkaliphilus]MBU8905568.1 hypothetical protein [Desertibacillus haloalkaliphilus]
MGYLSQVKVKGRRYIYLTEYIGMSRFTTKTEINVFSFGNREKALEKMTWWRKYFQEFPQELIDRGYGKKDLDEWIRTLETGKSKTGRSNKFKIKAK